MKRLIPILVFLCVVIAAHPARSASVPAEDSLKIGGTGDGLGLMRLCVPPFAKLHPDIPVDILSSLGSAGGIKAVAGGTIDIGLSGRPLRPEERTLGLREIHYANIPFIFVANKSVRAFDMTTREVTEIYSGKKLAWPDGQRIRLILRPENDSDSEMLRTLSPDMAAILQAALLRPGMILALTSQESADMAEKMPGAFGTSTLTLIMTERRALQVLSFNGIKPVHSGVAVRSYPFFKQLYLVTRTRQDESVRQFMDFLFSAAGRKILVQSGNLPPGPR